jgi:hypothetical protein
MKLRHIYIVAILVLSASLAMAQGTEKGSTSFGIIGGVNFQNFNGKDNSGAKLEKDLIVGYHIGANVQIPIAPGFYFQPGLLFTTKGAKDTNGGQTSTYHLSYIELPLNLLYKALLGKGFIMLGIGPYVGYAISGNTKLEGGSEAAIEFTNTIEAGDPYTTAYFKALDAGGNILAGYEMAGGVFLQLNAQLGLLEINPEDLRLSNDESIIKNTGFGLSIGYRF